jgi:electron transfer flavoprotein alpha subunit
MSILVFSEEKDLAFQLLSKARELAGHMNSSVYCLASGEPQDYLHYGADNVLLTELGDFEVEPFRTVLLKAIEVSNADLVIIGASKRGKEIAPRIAAALGVGCMNECNQINFTDGKIIVERLTYGGSTIARETCSSKPTIITVPANCFEKLEKTAKRGEIASLEVILPEAKVKVIERRDKPKGDQDLENADIIISAGRGFKNKEDIKLLEELGELLGGAAIGCSRPISADLGWMEEWVGISGKKVNPNLYITCGISGQIQHVAGIRDSKTIISINNDESAGIHKISDYSLMGDIYEVVPELIKALKEKA